MNSRVVALVTFMFSQMLGIWMMYYCLIEIFCNFNKTLPRILKNAESIAWSVIFFDNKSQIISYGSQFHRHLNGQGRFRMLQSHMSVYTHPLLDKNLSLCMPTHPVLGHPSNLTQGVLLDVWFDVFTAPDKSAPSAISPLCRHDRSDITAADRFCVLSVTLISLQTQ